MNNPVVVVDADAIVAQAFPDDSNHQLAVNISNKLAELHAEVIYPITAITEAVTVLQGKLNSGATAYGTAMAFTEPGVHIAEINQETLRGAVKYFSSSSSKKNTVFDCIVAIIAAQNKADAIFSFDKFYKSKGFKLAEEL